MKRLPLPLLVLAVGGCFSPSNPLATDDVAASTGGGPPSAPAPADGSTTAADGPSGDAESTAAATEVDDPDPTDGTTAAIDATTTGDDDSSSSDGGYESTSTGEQDTTKRVFVSEELLAPFMVANADALCQLFADDAELGGEWVSWTSDADIDARQKLDPSGGPYVLLDAAATVIANDGPDLIDGTLAAPIGVDEYGQPFDTVTAVWTGTQSDGTKADDACLDWTSSENVDTGLRGNVTITGGGWTQIASVGCATVARVYCFEV